MLQKYNNYKYDIRKSKKMAKETNKRLFIWINNREIENNIKAIQAEFNKVKNELKQATRGSEEYNQKLKELKKLKEILDEHKKAVQTVAEAHAESKKNIQNTFMALGGVSAALQGANNAVQSFVSSMQEYVEAYAKVDKAMQDVVKSSGLARSVVEQLNEEFKHIDTRTSTEELLKIAEVGGHLGLTKEQLRDFVQYTDQAMQTIGMSAEDVANSFSKIQRTFSDVSGQDIATTIQQAGSAMNALDKVTTSTEANIMAFTEAVGKMSDGIKPSLADTLALGAAFESAGLDAQQAATGYARILTTARADIGKFTSVMGKTEEELRDLINTKPAEFLLEFAESLKGLPTAEQGEKLKELGLNSQRLDSTIGALTKNTQEFRTALSLSAEEYSKATAMTENYNALNSTAAAQLEKAKKRMQDAKAELGKELIPILIQLYETLNKGAGWIKEHIILVKTVAIALGLWISTITAYKAIQITANALLAITNGLHKAHRIVLLASAAAQALFNKNLTRAQAATVLMRRELPSLTAAFKTLGSSLSTIGNVFLRIVKLGPIAFLAGVTGAVIKANREANEGKRIIKQLDEQAHETLTQSMADIEAEKLKIQQLRKIIHDETASREEKLKAIKNIQAIVPGYVAELSEEGKVVRENTKAIDDYIAAVSRKAQAAVMEEELKDLYKQILKLRKEVGEEEDLYYSTNLWDRIKATWKDADDSKGSRKRRSLNDLQEKADNLEKEIAELLKSSVKNDSEVTTKEKDDCTGDPATCQCEYHKKQREEDKKAAEKEAEEERKKLIKQRNDFQEKLKSMREDEQIDSLNGWEKVKAEIIRKYAEIEKEAAKLYGKDSEMVKNVQKQKNDAIAAAGQKYLEKTKDFVTNFATEIDKMLADTQADSGQPQSRLVTAIAGSDKEWEKVIAKAEEKAKALEKILSGMDENDPLRNVFATQLDAVQDQIDAAKLKQAEARAAITKKFVEEEMKGLKQREKEQQRQIALNKQGITEEQKAALQRQWKIDDLREEYDVEIKLTEAALKTAEANKDTEGIKNIEKMIEKLKELKENVEATVDAAEGGKKKRTGNDLIDLITGNITDPKERFQAVINVMQDFANQAMDIYRQIADVQQQSAELEMQRFSEAQDAKARKLKQQLDDGLISQKYYDAQMEKMEAEKERREKKMKHDQFEKEKQASIVQSVIQGALSVATTIAQWGLPWGLIPAAIAAATAAVQTALIASQVNPYAKGGYIRKKQLALVGEEGQEWVASNSLLEDEETAPIIAALEEYQRGNRNAMRLVAPTQPAWKNLSQSASQISSTFASNRTPVVHNHYQSVGNDELLKEVKQMNQFLADPKNRQAYISYKIQTEAQKNRDFIKQAARL